MNFSVWSPFAQKIDLVLDSVSLPMRRTERGWWQVEAPGTLAGSRYQFRVDDKGPYPDPRSAWQPDGLHAASVVYDHSSFPWRDGAFVPRPLSDAVIYELHVGTFTPEGNYAAAANRLDHLKNLGITHVELMPISTFPGQRGWGYDGAALFAPHAAYGTPDDLKSFIQRAHSIGLAVLLDVVYNHLGPDGNYLGAFGPYFTSKVKTPWGDAINFDGEHCDAVCEFFLDNALMWLGNYHFDGLRLDAVHAIFDHSAVHILEALASRVGELSTGNSRPYVLIAESDFNSPRLVHSVTRGGFGLDAHWEDDFHHALHAFLTGETDGFHSDFGSLAQIAKALRQAYVFDGQFSDHRKRMHGRPPTHVDPSQVVVFAQNHDQTGNRALGERMSHLLEPPILKATAALVLLSPFVPMLFQGEEWGADTPFLFFTEHGDELGRLVTEGRQREFAGFHRKAKELSDPQAPETFQRSKLNWSELDDPAHQDIFDWHRNLIHLRRAIPHGTPVAVEYDELDRWLTLRRGSLIAVFNFCDGGQAIPLPPGEWHPSVPANSVFPGHSTSILTGIV